MIHMIYTSYGDRQLSKVDVSRACLAASWNNKHTMPVGVVPFQTIKSYWDQMSRFELPPSKRKQLSFRCRFLQLKSANISVDGLLPNACRDNVERFFFFVGICVGWLMNATALSLYITLLFRFLIFGWNNSRAAKEIIHFLNSLQLSIISLCNQVTTFSLSLSFFFLILPLDAFFDEAQIEGKCSYSSCCSGLRTAGWLYTQNKF